MRRARRESIATTQLWDTEPIDAVEALLCDLVSHYNCTHGYVALDNGIASKEIATCNGDYDQYESEIDKVQGIIGRNIPVLVADMSVHPLYKDSSYVHSGKKFALFLPFHDANRVYIGDIGIESTEARFDIKWRDTAYFMTTVKKIIAIYGV